MGGQVQAGPPLPIPPVHTPGPGLYSIPPPSLPKESTRRESTESLRRRESRDSRGDDDYKSHRHSSRRRRSRSRSRERVK